MDCGSQVALMVGQQVLQVLGLGVSNWTVKAQSAVPVVFRMGTSGESLERHLRRYILLCLVLLAQRVRYSGVCFTAQTTKHVDTTPHASTPLPLPHCRDSFS